MTTPISFFVLTATALWLTAASPTNLSAAESGQARLRVTIHDEVGNQIPARAWVTQGDQQYFQPDSPTTAIAYARDQSFSCPGQFEMTLDSGPVKVHIERGKEWLPVDLELELKPETMTDRVVTLKRWINLKSEGYYSADLHIHLGNENPAVLDQLASADDLDVVPAFTLWWTGHEETLPHRWPAWNIEAPYLTESGRWLTANNLEIERIASRTAPGSTVGASFFYNLRQPLPVSDFDPRFPTDTDLCLLARALSPEVVIDTDKPSWAETAVGAILGAYDTVQVCHNHFHRQQTLAGGWGMMGPLAEDERPLEQKNELFHRTNRHYYAFLNCGIRLGVSGGSAIGVMPVPAGYSRVYAKVDPPFSVPRFWQAVKAGRSFATSGPFITMTIDGHEPGATLHLRGDNPEKLSIKLSTHSTVPLRSIELIHNGAIVRQLNVVDLRPSPTIHTTNDLHHTPTRSGWYATRIIYESPAGHLRQAHTSPIYALINNQPIAFKSEATYLSRWIDRLMAIAERPNRYENTNKKAEVIATYLRAKEAYARVAKIATEVWGD